MCQNYGGWCDTFFCIRDIRRAVSVIGMFSLTTSLLQILVQVAVFTGLNQNQEIKFDDLGDKEKVTAQLYIALACADFLMVVFAVILFYGNERSDEIQSRKFLIPWAIMAIIYIMYECAVNIVYFVFQFGDKYTDEGDNYLPKGHPTGYIIVPLVYWIIKDIFLFIGFLFVVMRIRALTPVTQYVEEYRQDYEPVRERVVTVPAPVVTVREPSVVVKPSIVLPTPVQMGGCNSCSACSGNKCSHCSKPTPLYGYAGPQASNVPKSGWTTSIYNQGR